MLINIVCNFYARTDIPAQHVSCENVLKHLHCLHYNIIYKESPNIWISLKGICKQPPISCNIFCKTELVHTYFEIANCLKKHKSQMCMKILILSCSSILLWCLWYQKHTLYMLIFLFNLYYLYENHTLTKSRNRDFTFGANHLMFF